MSAEVAVPQPSNVSGMEAEGQKGPEPEQNGDAMKPEQDSGKPQSEQNGGAHESAQNGGVSGPGKNGGNSEVGQNAGEPEPEAEGGGRHEGDLDYIREGETTEEALQRRIEEGRIGKGRNVRKWKDTEEKQRKVESGRHQSKVRRYGKIYEEVRALRKETRHSVQDLRERFKDKGVIQNKDQFIVRLIAQERTEQEGKVAAIKSLQQWRLTDIELHNFLNRCHKRGLAGKLELAKQWVFEQMVAGGEVTFKEGLAFYSSIGILQPRSSAQTQQQWREWREWEDAMTAALEEQRGRKGGASEDGAGPAAPDVSCNDDSTVCSSPWSSERGGSGSFGCSNGNFRSSSAHGEGDVAGGYGSARYRSGSGTGTAPEVPKESLRVAVGRGKTPSDQGSPRQKDWWSWKSYSPPAMFTRPRSLEGVSRLPLEKRASAFGPVANGKGEGTHNRHVHSPVPPMPMVDTPEGSESSSKAAEAVVRAAGGYLPPRHRLTGLQLSPARLADRNTFDRAPSSTSDPGESSGTISSENVAPESGSGAKAARIEDEARLKALAELEASVETGAGRTRNSDPTSNYSRGRVGVRARGVARTRAKGPAGGGSPTLTFDLDEGPAPTEELGIGNVGGSDSRWRQGKGKTSRDDKSRSLSGVISGLADWFIPSTDKGQHKELLMEVYPTVPSTPPSHGETKSAPATPRGRPKASSVLREGGWFYNGDSDYSSSDEDGNHDSEDEGFWADAGTTEPPRHLGGGGGESILDRLRRLFT